MKFSFTVTRNDEEIDLTIEGTYQRAIKGSRDGRFGPPLEPDEPECFDIDSATYQGNEIELTDKEYEDAADEGLRQLRGKYEDDREDRAYENYLDTL